MCYRCPVVRSLALAFAFAALFIACGGSSSTDPPRDPLPTSVLVPDALPTTRTASDRTLPNCTVDDLHSDLSLNAFAGGEENLWIDISNASDTSCILPHLPEVRFKGAEGDVRRYRAYEAATNVCVPLQRVGYCRFEGPMELPPSASSLDDQERRSLSASMSLSYLPHDGTGVCSSPRPEVVNIEMDFDGLAAPLIVDATDVRRSVQSCSSEMAIVTWYAPAARK